MALKDLLAVEGVDPETGDIGDPVFDKNDETVDQDAIGYHIMTMVNFGEQALIHNMGVEVKKALQQGKLKLPVNVARYGTNDDTFLEDDDEIELAKAFREVMALKKECAMIRAVPSGNWFKFEMPSSGESGESRRELRKDRWTSLCLSLWAAKQWTSGGEAGGGCVGFWGS